MYLFDSVRVQRYPSISSSLVCALLRPVLNPIDSTISGKRPAGGIPGRRRHTGTPLEQVHIQHKLHAVGVRARAKLAPIARARQVLHR